MLKIILICNIMRRLSLEHVYQKLFSAYGRQGWWPMHRAAPGGQGAGYHPGRYDLPRTAGQRFEVVVGAVLTQNTTWKNVQGVIDQLGRARLFTPERLLELPEAELAGLIRPTGYYNQKARKLQAASRFFLSDGSLKTGKAPARAALLAIWGVGPETADSILLYAFRAPVFVVDAYTKRLVSRLGWLEASATYEKIQALFMETLTPEAELYNEYHALIVQHAKIHCRQAPLCRDCVLRQGCKMAKAVEAVEAVEDNG